MTSLRLRVCTLLCPRSGILFSNSKGFASSPGEFTCVTQYGTWADERLFELEASLVVAKWAVSLVVMCEVHGGHTPPLQGGDPPTTLLPASPYCMTHNDHLVFY